MEKISLLDELSDREFGQFAGVLWRVSYEINPEHVDIDLRKCCHLTRVKFKLYEDEWDHLSILLCELIRSDCSIFPLDLIKKVVKLIDIHTFGDCQDISHEGLLAEFAKEPWERFI
jgi:hypothetical protein